MATAFTRDYTQFNPDPVIGPNTWVLNSAGAHPGGGGGSTTSAYVFTAEVPIVQTTLNGATTTVNTTFEIPRLPTLPIQ